MLTYTEPEVLITCPAASACAAEGVSTASLEFATPPLEFVTPPPSPPPSPSAACSQSSWGPDMPRKRSRKRLISCAVIRLSLKGISDGKPEGKD